MTTRIAAAAGIFATLTTGVTAVVYANFSARVMPSLGRMANATGISKMQGFNRTAEQAPFMICVFGAAIAGCYLIYRVIRSDRSVPDILLAAGGGAYLAGLLLTIAYNVPLNDKLATLDPHAASSVAVWRDYLHNWTAANTVRTVFSAAAVVLLIAGLVGAARARSHAEPQSLAPRVDQVTTRVTQ
jgi:uncharacterized membrane protein